MWSATALLLVALAADAPRVEAPLDDGWRFAGVPIVSYGSDVGLTLGAATFLYRPLPGTADEADMLSLSASYATRGPAVLDATFEARRLLDTSLRAVLNLHLGDDDRMPYWGEGAALGGLPVPAGYGTPPDPYRYHDRRVFLAAALRGAIVGGLGWHARVRYLLDDVAAPSPLLAASNPPGARGGRVALGEVGLLYDTRDRELGTHSGVYATAALFAAPQIQGLSDFAFHGWDVAVRGYLPLLPGLTLAARALYDRKVAGAPAFLDQNRAVPFFERMLYEGIAYGEGLGGSGTVRGIARYRLAGDEKALLNVQLRAALATTHLFDHVQEWGLGAGVDAGLARQPGYPIVTGAGAVVGLRFAWDHTILLRVELGAAPGGDGTLYIAFGELF